ncbi:hypothetical protein [Vibrio genomosp. F10]|uniref:Uncharacterized protein n=1 Tax=Vibrio genomosp. F10 str. ZF-129 TaxID=1187848 RepID=A0A1E5BFQ5_9VIBR|nr:hypothetical protein [Vibrio genomosp. F10]OEE34648.1 hypothetical protein A1QO_07375 [Vibrio genomosp. F10 str. ZF-129]OEE93771.1 hypothetical protein A1QM_08255 [Vibrio genomosp. F10 str. 9ZC157]OEF03695.1 hypothetical protein A1QK_10460 [Vibrio genomosp. F10 str. 9ZD137]OEF05126.1 hypothetical protein A1QI_08710 [Vibrio genomosp. F10 str. 9ZB36]
MELKQDPRCYTDVCVDGYWYHYDHCTTRAYVLKGGSSPELILSKEPKTEAELISLLKGIGT